MARGLLLRKTRALIKKETTYATDAAPTAADDLVSCYDPVWQMPEEIVDRNLVTGDFSASESIRNRGYGTFSMGVELKGSGTAGTAPEWGPLLQACGFSETIVTNTSVTYQPVTGGEDSVTAWFYRDGNLWKYTGGRGTVTFSRGVSGVPMMNFEFMALKVDTGNPGQAAFPATGSTDSSKPVASVLSTFTFGGTAYDMTNFEIAMGVVVSPIGSINGPTGYSEMQITGRDVNGSFDPQETLTGNIANLVVANDAHVLNWSSGGTAGNIVTINCPKCVLQDSPMGGRDGVSTYTANFKPARDAGDDEITVVLT